MTETATPRRMHAHQSHTVADANQDRFTLRLAGEAGHTVRRLAREKGVSVNEFIRQAIGTEVYLQEQHARGARILLEDKDRSNVREIVIR